MCGICGYVGCNRPEILEPMCSAMAHRGPDDSGTWHDAQAAVGLGHRRLSIIDLSSAGHQPMANADGMIHLSYNGEMYNFQEYRERLSLKGHEFRGHSDTEVLLHLYEEYGIDSLNMLNGIFAFAVWDSKQRELVLARDHAGVKPLYYWQDGEKLFFASEIKALLRIPEMPRELNEEAVLQFLTFLWVPGEETMLKPVKKLEPGHYLVWKNGQLSIRQWFQLDYTPDNSIGEADWIDQVQETFIRTTRRQMVSDAPLGAFLSGGLDSSSIVACMRAAHPEREINCYTMRYKEEELKREGFVHDYPYAKKVADRHNVNLKTQTVTKDVMSLLPKLVYHLDEPDADPAAILTYIISEMASRDGVKVLLSGTGGDEVFFGYRSHQAYKRFAQCAWIPSALVSPLLSSISALATATKGAQSALARRTRKFNRAFRQRGLSRHLALVDWSSPEDRLRIVDNGLARTMRQETVPACMQKYFDSFVGKGDTNRHSHILLNTFLASHNFLYTDKATMALGIEARVPFVDVELLRLAARIPERIKLRGPNIKHVLSKAMASFLPREVLERDKTGFAPPLRHWIAEGLGELIQETLSPSRVRDRGLFRPDLIQSILTENRDNVADHGYLIYALLSLELWQQTFIDRPGQEVIV